MEFNTNPKYSFEATIGMDNGYGNDWSSSVIELNDKFEVVGVYTEYFGNNGVEEGIDELVFNSNIEKYKKLTKEQLACLEAAVEGFKQGFTKNCVILD
jgi:hypothetical protein